MQRLPERVESPRLVIRRWQPGDVDALMAAVADSIEHLRPWMPWIADEPLNRAQRLTLIDEWTTAWASGGDAVYGAFLRAAPAGSDPGTQVDDGSIVVGGTGLHRRLGPGGLEIGYWVHAHHTRRGYATEIARALVGAAFADDEIDRVEIHHDEANGPSAGIPRRLGFTCLGTEPSEKTAPGESGRECAWRTTRDQWFS